MTENLKTNLSSKTRTVEVQRGKPTVIIGERINPTGKKLYSQELKEGKTSYIRKEAQAQTEAGAHLLDVNCGAPGVDEPAALERAVFAVTGVAAAPLVLDSSDPAALERGLKAADGKVLINSVCAEEKSLRAILPLAARYGAAVIGLALDGQGIPKSAEGRVAAGRTILEAALAAGLRREDVLIDCLTLTVSAEQEGARETLRALRLVRSELGLGTVLGVSNISFGLAVYPRRVLNSVFTHEAVNHGLDIAIVNYQKIYPLYKIPDAEVEVARKLIYHDTKDVDPLQNYIAFFAAEPEAQAVPSVDLSLK